MSEAGSPKADGPADAEGDSATAGYKVGYKRPPLATRFRPGGVGNPRGRPKRRKTVAHILDQELMRTVRIDGQSVTLQQLILRKLVHDAARGNLAAIRALFSLQDRYRDSADVTIDPAVLAGEDRKIIEGYLASFRTNEVAAGTASGPRETDEAAAAPDSESREPAAAKGQ